MIEIRILDQINFITTQKNIIITIITIIIMLILKGIIINMNTMKIEIITLNLKKRGTEKENN